MAKYKCVNDHGWIFYNTGEEYELSEEDISYIMRCHPEDFELVTESPATGAKKNDTTDKKLKYRFVHQTLIDECAKSMMAGEIKYGAYNYLKGHTVNQLIDAAIRHLKEYQEGETIDKDTTARGGIDVTHIGCALANLNMLLIQEKHGTLTDDRPIIEGVIKDELES